MRYLLLFLLLPLPALAQNWTVIPLGTSGTLRALDNASFSQKYLVGDGGFVALSNADHTAWTPVNVGTTADLYSHVRPTSTQVWVGGVAGVVRVRDVAGVWHGRDIPSAETFFLFSRSSGVALAAGSGGSIWKSSDLGQNWTQHYAGATPLRAGIGGTFGDGWVVGDDGVLLKGTGNGTMWAPVASGTTQDLHGIRFGAGTSIVAVGAGGTILFSADGTTWAPRASGTGRTLRDVSISGQNANWLLAVGDDGVALKSTDGGALWCRMTTGVSDDLYAAVMVSNGEYVVAGENGLLLRTTTSGGPCVPGLDATLTRVGGGSIPPGGGPLSFTVALTNPTPEVQPFQAWVDAVLPNGNVFGPFLGPQALTFNPGQSVGPLSFTRSVPGNAPSGTYTLRLRVGDFATGALLDESTFTFFKSATAGPVSEAAVAEAFGVAGAFLETVGIAATVPPIQILSAIQPNPAEGEAAFTLTPDQTQHVVVAVYDVRGRRVASVFEGRVSAGEAVPLTLDTRRLPPGGYVVRATGETFVESRRLTVVR